MEAEKKKRVIKNIKVDLDKCHGCRACEVACSIFHASPKYGAVNPARSRIRVIRDDLNNVFLPVRAGAYSKAECAGRQEYIMEGRSFGECNWCNAACPSRDLFFEPDSGLPLRCDMCEDIPALEKPMCVQWCKVNALIYEEREEEGEETPKLEELETGIEALVEKFGVQKVMDAIARMAEKE